MTSVIKVNLELGLGARLQICHTISNQLIPARNRCRVVEILTADMKPAFSIATDTVGNVCVKAIPAKFQTILFHIT